MFQHLHPELEPSVAKAVEQLRQASLVAQAEERGTEATAEEVRTLCEVTATLLSQMLVSNGDWPEDRYIDGIIPLSVSTAEEQCVELAGGAIVAQGDDWFVEPLLARYVVDEGMVSELVLLFGNALREPPVFDPECETFELEFPSQDEPDAWRFSFSAQEEPLVPD
jgi:hypothetical protein